MLYTNNIDHDNKEYLENLLLSDSEGMIAWQLSLSDARSLGQPRPRTVAAS